MPQPQHNAGNGDQQAEADDGAEAEQTPAHPPFPFGQGQLPVLPLQVPDVVGAPLGGQHDQDNRPLQVAHDVYAADRHEFAYEWNEADITP